MFSHTALASHSKEETYLDLASQIQGLLANETDRIANTANFCSFLFHALPDLNWAGFYFLSGNELVVGPFQGKPACVRIALGKGVCGTAALTRKTQVVADVHQFPGHIACDPASRSEIVIPMLTRAGFLLGVWDVDSPTLGRFDEDDRVGMERLIQHLIEVTQWQPPSPKA